MRKPFYVDGTLDLVSVCRLLSQQGLTVALVKDATEDGELTVTLDPSLAAGLIDGLTYLEHYPYECNEQTVSRFLPNLFTVHALQSLAINDPALSTRLQRQQIGRASCRERV